MGAIGPANMEKERHQCSTTNPSRESSNECNNNTYRYLSHNQTCLHHGCVVNFPYQPVTELIENNLILHIDSFNLKKNGHCKLNQDTIQKQCNIILIQDHLQKISSISQTSSSIYCNKSKKNTSKLKFTLKLIDCQSFHFYKVLLSLFLVLTMACNVTGNDFFSINKEIEPIEKPVLESKKACEADRFQDPQQLCSSQNDATLLEKSEEIFSTFLLPDENVPMPMRRTLWTHPEEPEFVMDYDDDDYYDNPYPEPVSETLSEDQYNDTINTIDNDNRNINYDTEAVMTEDGGLVPLILTQGTDQLVRDSDDIAVVTTSKDPSILHQNLLKLPLNEHDHEHYGHAVEEDPNCCNSTYPRKRLKISYSSSIVENGKCTLISGKNM